MPSGDPDWQNSNGRQVRISLAPHAVLLMPLRGPTGHEMNPNGFIVSQKAACKSGPGHLVSSAWCLWIIYIQEKNGFQYL